MRFFATLFDLVERRLGLSRRSSSRDVKARARLRAACARLPEPARSVYLASARDGLPFDEIAARLELSVATVERELAIALYLLASDDIGVTSGPIDR